MMEEIRLYDMNSIEFSELIDTARVELKKIIYKQWLIMQKTEKK